MKVNRWFSIWLVLSAYLLTSVSMTTAFSDDNAKPGQGDKTAKPGESKIKAALAKLPEADRSAAAAQRYCPVMDTVRLGAMDTPVKVVIEGKPVFLCCGGCKDEAIGQGKKTLTKVEKLKKAAAAVAKLPAADQPLAEAQLFCPIQEGSRLGSMGMPVKLILEGKPVFVCCKGCEDPAHEDAKATLAKVDEIKKENAKAAHQDEEVHEPKKATAPKK